MKLLERLLQTKTLGIILILFSIALAFVLVPPSIQTAEANAAQCTSKIQMTWEQHLTAEFYLSMFLVISIGIIGAFLALKSQEREKMDKQLLMKLSEAKKKLKGDEKKIYEIVASNEGVIFQSELVEKAGYAKAKVSRILDKLEGKGLVERRRRGLSNVILIKYH